MTITKLYYFPLMIDPVVPITDETLIGEYTRLDPARLSDFVWLYDTLQRHLNTLKPDWPGVKRS